MIPKKCFILTQKDNTWIGFVYADYITHEGYGNVTHFWYNEHYILGTAGHIKVEEEEENVSNIDTTSKRADSSL